MSTTIPKQGSKNEIPQHPETGIASFNVMMKPFVPDDDPSISKYAHSLTYTFTKDQVRKYGREQLIEAAKAHAAWNGYVNDGEWEEETDPTTREFHYHAPTLKMAITYSL